MVWLIGVFAAVIPLQIAAAPVLGVLLEPWMLFAGLVGLFACGSFVKRGGFVARKDVSWLAPFIGWLAIGIISAFLSPAYELSGLWKMLAQVVGVSVMMITAVAIRETCGRGRRPFLSIVRFMLIGLAVLAYLGAWQFFAFNLIQTSAFADWSFVNDVTDITDVWRSPGSIGGIVRVSSFAPEPAHFAQFLLAGLGIALVRLGVMGRALAKAAKGIVSAPTALIIIFGMLTSLSVIGYTGFLLILAALAAVAIRKRQGTRGATVFVAAITVAIAAAGHWTEAFADLSEKARSARYLVADLEPANGISSGNVAGSAVSALALRANLEVTLHALDLSPAIGVGFGMHPHLYADATPGWVTYVPAVRGLNKEDAGSLMLRLLSESGILGTALFLIGWLQLIRRAYRAVSRRMTDLAWRDDRVLAVCVGILASCIALTGVYMIRMGVYFSPSLWFMFGLTAAVPTMLPRQRLGGEDTGGRVRRELRLQRK